MALNIKEILVASILPIIKTIGKVQLEDLLQQLHDHNPKELYEETLRGLHASFKLLDGLALKTKTKIDDGIIDIVLEAVEENAVANGLTL